MLYYNTVSNIMRIYSGSAWENVAVSTAGFATLTGVETLTNKTLTSPKINEDVVVTSTATELNKLDALSRGSILYGNASAVTSILTKGTAAQVLTSDGTDISWGDAFSGIAWQSVQTTGFTAAVGNAYPCDTTSAAFTVTLPASASVGDQVQLVDYAGTFATNNITLTSSLNIEGGALDKTLTTNREGVTITYVDATQGWVASSGVNSGSQALDPPIQFLVVAGGGGGGGRETEGGGGGGAGGYRTSTQTVNSGTVITVTVGDGGAGSAGASDGSDGSNSSISGSGLTTITSTGGGGGGNGVAPTGTVGHNGGSGGGSGCYYTASGGLGNSPSTTPSQGNNGGSAGSAAPYGGGGGGGAGVVGGNASSGVVGAGGNGVANSITGSEVYYAGGGGGGCASSGTAGLGGTGGGADGSNGTPNPATSGTVNTGGGGGGNGNTNSSAGGAGGKGVVILSVPTSIYTGTSTGSPTVTTSGSSTIIKFTGSGSYTA
jgi:hypothetical protein